MTAFATGARHRPAEDAPASAKVRHVRADVIAVTRSGEAREACARVRLHFRLGDQSAFGTHEIVTCIRVAVPDHDHWQRTKRRILRRAWQWLHDYFDGAGFGDDCRNLFAEAAPDSAERNEYGLTEEQERSLQRELRAIERDCLAEGQGLCSLVSRAG